MRNKYEDMSKKELLQIAKVYNIKGRYKMKKEELINALKKSKKPLKEVKKIEEELKTEITQKKLEDHLELLPKEPGVVFVNWQVETKDLGTDEGELKLIGGKKEILDLPVKISQGKGYIRVEEGITLKAVIGFKEKNHFKHVISSEPILVPRGSTAVKNEVKWGKVSLEKKNLERKSVPTKLNKEMEKEKEKLEKEAKNIKYIRYPRE